MSYAISHLFLNKLSVLQNLVCKLQPINDPIKEDGNTVINRFLPLTESIKIKNDQFDLIVTLYSAIEDIDKVVDKIIMHHPSLIVDVV